MRTKKYMIMAFVGVLAASCANDEFTAMENSAEIGGIDRIEFGGTTKKVTRATHEESAALLNNVFWVYGTKTTGANTTTLFDNYRLEYTAQSAGSTETNVADWEYVGLTSKKGAAQSVKYWDFSADKYDFVAAAGLVANEEIKNTTDGFRVNVNNVDALSNIYVADRITATPTAQAATTTTPATAAYRSTIQFQFRRLGARMRIGFYETVPGYAVKDLVFYYIGAPHGSYNVGVGSAFPTSGKYTIKYDDATNEAVTSFAGAGNTMAFFNDFGLLEYTSALSQAGDASQPYMNADGSPSATPVNAFLGTTAAEATFGMGDYTIDGVAGVHSDFKPILPNENNSLKMQLRVDYTLVALDGSGDEIRVRDAYVSVPIDYLQWKPNYSYTYLFKITDNSNGYTGEGGGGDINPGPGRNPDPDNGGGDNDPDPNTPPYIPNPTYPEIEDPDNPGTMIPDPSTPLIPNPNYPPGPGGDQHDPSNPVPTPTIPDPDPSNPGGIIPDPENPSNLYPITFDAIVVEVTSGNSVTTYTVIDGTDNSSDQEH